MRIKKLFNTETEFLDFAWNFIKPDRDKIWRDEDMPLLQPFFDASKGGNLEIVWTEEVKQSFDHFQKCCQEYSDQAKEIRNNCRLFCQEEIADFFYLESINLDLCDCDDDGNPIDEDGNIISEITRKSLKISDDYKNEIVFPIVFIGEMISDYDRCGPVKSGYSEFVSLNDFKKINDTVITL